MFDDNRLRTFAAIVEKGSFTAAAKSLGVSQPAVSQLVSDMEQEIGGQLFDRSTHIVKLTPKGEVLKLFAEKILSQYDTLDAILSDFDSYEDFIGRAAALRNDPSYSLFKELI